MTSIFIITGSSGQYSDHAEWNVCAVHSEDRARTIVAMLDQASTYDQEFNEQRRKFQCRWEIDNPAPKLLNGKTKRQKERMPQADMLLARHNFETQWIKRNDDYKVATEAFAAANYNQPAETIAFMKKFDIKPGTIGDVSYGYEEMVIEDSGENE